MEKNQDFVIEILLDQQSDTATPNELAEQHQNIPSFSLEQLKLWNSWDLKNFCNKFGLGTSNRSKEELIALAYSAQVMNLPVVPSAVQNMLTAQKEYKTLLTLEDGTLLPDPLTDLAVHTWQNEENGMLLWPKVTANTIEKYFISKGEQNISQYKKRKGYEYHSSEWIKEIWTSVHDDYVFLKAQCSPSQKVSSPPHNVWILAGKTSRKILRSYCTCTAG